MESYRPADVATEEGGHVIETADGIAHVEGLPGTMANELLRFEDGTLGLAMNLDRREIGAVVLGDFGGIEEGQLVHRTGEVLSVPVGDGYLGRTVDPLGRPIDGLGDITHAAVQQCERRCVPGAERDKQAVNRVQHHHTTASIYTTPPSIQPEEQGVLLDAMPGFGTCLLPGMVFCSL